MDATIKPHSLLAVNLFANKAGLIVRKLMQNTEKPWSGSGLADELGLKPRWVNGILDTLESYKFVVRQGRGHTSTTRLSSPHRLLDHWKTVYRFSHHKFYQYYVPDVDPVDQLKRAAGELGFQWALTGIYAVNLLQNRSRDLPGVYLCSRGSQKELRGLLTKLEDKFNFLPVMKKANIILIQPKDVDGIFFDLRYHQGMPVVSALQLDLDLSEGA